MEHIEREKVLPSQQTKDILLFGTNISFVCLRKINSKIFLLSSSSFPFASRLFLSGRRASKFVIKDREKEEKKYWQIYNWKIVIMKIKYLIWERSFSSFFCVSQSFYAFQAWFYVFQGNSFWGSNYAYWCRYFFTPLYSFSTLLFWV